MTKFFIRDCHDQIVGNPAGYATFRGASRIESGKNSAVRHAIWDTFCARESQEIAAGIPKEERRRNISSIKQNDEYRLKVSKA